MFPKLFFFISLLFCSLIFAHSYDNTQCLDHQKNLLLHLKSELLFESSLSTKLVQWNQTNNCCHWHGVECDGAGHVVSLQLDDEYISGGIGDSSSLFGLEYLEKLNLAYNDFNSSLIPKGLSVLDLSMNQLSGTIPSCLLNDTMDLTVLDLGRNNISGHIPDSFRTKGYLQYLNLSNNTLQGKIPNSLKSCKWLELMNLGNNLINDTFPCMISSSLQVLVLRSNRFHGEVKCHNNSWPELQIIDISSNDFSGTLKSINFSSWRGMLQGSYPQRERTELMYNGSVAPKAGVRITMKGLEVDIFKIFPEFTTVDFSSNNFHGEIPKAIGDLSSLRLLNFSHNALNGSIPKSFGKLGELESLDISQNQLTEREEEGDRLGLRICLTRICCGIRRLCVGTHILSKLQIQILWENRRGCRRNVRCKRQKTKKEKIRCKKKKSSEGSRSEEALKVLIKLV